MNASDSRPALGELARRVIKARSAWKALPDDSPDFAEYHEYQRALEAFRDACSPDAVVALASGGAAGGLQQDTDLDKTTNVQQQEPEPKGESSARCECASCVAHRVYVFGLRCCPRGLTRGVNYMVYALPKLSAFPHSHRRLPK